ncbi:hypothetical protein RIF25_06685 [Thermosynechococcaceae cyanobacterium BACA0444]|uniref:Uncharacterized protein n=1 Tax=Pseudocalidococcus azoricus BACA0444 TaxID=2918990 RepID=A0AAE4FQQ5_9CYAN|nr:hypothetical protein [Pseudocalidococcus azoricus]MDS3860493.1 hypothetical protein [Pseudocalidococcus azoricus BACA0444]
MSQPQNIQAQEKEAKTRQCKFYSPPQLEFFGHLSNMTLAGENDGADFDNLGS